MILICVELALATMPKASIRARYGRPATTERCNGSSNNVVANEMNCGICHTENTVPAETAAAIFHVCCGEFAESPSYMNAHA